MKKVSAILTAGGSGTRFGSDKQLAKIKGKPVACISAEKLLKHPLIDELIVVTKFKRIDTFTHYFQENCVDINKIRYITDGPERYDSNFNGMKRMGNNTDIVLIHDGARPFLTYEMISLSINAVIEEGYAASYVCRKVIDTIRKVNSDESTETIPRDSLTSVQTPQVVYYSDWMNAYALIKEWEKQGIKITDDINMIELLMKHKEESFRVKPIITDDSPYNIKITYPGDIALANIWLTEGKVNV